MIVEASYDYRTPLMSLLIDEYYNKEADDQTEEFLPALQVRDDLSKIIFDDCQVRQIDLDPKVLLDKWISSS